MKKWYITPSNNILIDTESQKAISVEDNSLSIHYCYIAPEDCTIEYTNSEGTKEFEVKEGQLVLTFYRDSFVNKIVVIDSPEILENLNKYKEELQAEKERWASDCCGKCPCSEKISR